MITHNTEKQRFERTENGLTAVVEYRRNEEEIELTHTFVPPALEGQGIAGSLTRAALEYARAENLRVRPICSYARAYIRRHPEYDDPAREPESPDYGRPAPAKTSSRSCESKNRRKKSM